MNKISKQVAHKCPIHRLVTEACRTALEEDGFFEKDKVIKATSTEGVAEAIRWDYIREFIQEDGGVELIPMAAAFFKRHNIKLHDTVPQKYMATGHSKKTAGYASVTYHDGVFARKKLQHLRRLTNGVGAAYERYVEACAKQDVLVDHEDKKRLEEAA